MYSLMTLFYNTTPTTKINTLSLHDALPIYPQIENIFNPMLDGRKDLDSTKYGYKLTTPGNYGLDVVLGDDLGINESEMRDRKSTRLNSSHSSISYAVFCLTKKKQR